MVSVYELDRQLADVAGQLILKHPLRAYDAVQVAAALRVQSVFAQARTSTATFVSADDRDA